MCAIQDAADYKYQCHDQSDDNHDAHGVGFRFVPVIGGKDGVQQVVDIAAMNLWYNKLHTLFQAQIRPAMKRPLERYRNCGGK